MSKPLRWLIQVEKRVWAPMRSEQIEEIMKRASTVVMRAILVVTGYVKLMAENVENVEDLGILLVVAREKKVDSSLQKPTSSTNGTAFPILFLYGSSIMIAGKTFVDKLTLWKGILCSRVLMTLLLL